MAVGTLQVFYTDYTVHALLTRIPGVVTNVDAGAVSMIVSIFLFLSISLMDAPVEIDADVETVMEL